MAFHRVTRVPPTRSTADDAPILTVSATGEIRANVAAYIALGSPMAVTLDWDPELTLLRMNPAARDDADAYPVTAQRIRMGGKVLAGIGVGVPRERVRVPMVRLGLSLVADLSDLPAAGATRTRGAA